MSQSSCRSWRSWLPPGAAIATLAALLFVAAAPGQDPSEPFPSDPPPAASAAVGQAGQAGQDSQGGQDAGATTPAGGEPRRHVLAAEVGAAEPPPPAERKTKPYIAGLGVVLEQARALLSFRLVEAFDENLERRIESGLATSLDYGIELVRVRRFWFNKTVGRSRLEVVALYNAVSREYLVNTKHDGNLISSRVVRDREGLRAAMTEIEDLPVFDLSQQQGDLRLRVRAELGTGSILFFIPTLRATDWAEARLRVDDARVEVVGF